MVRKLRDWGNTALSSFACLVLACPAKLHGQRAASGGIPRSVIIVIEISQHRTFAHVFPHPHLPMSAIMRARKGTKRAVMRQEMANPVRTMNRRTPPGTPGGLQCKIQ